MRDLRVCGSEHVILVLAEVPTVAELRAAEAYWIGLGKHFKWPLLNKVGMPKRVEPEMLMPEGKRWSAENWRRDPEVRAALARARENKVSKRNK